jgi:hypothetical protein
LMVTLKGAFGGFILILVPSNFGHRWRNHFSQKIKCKQQEK